MRHNYFSGYAPLFCNFLWLHKGTKEISYHSQVCTFEEINVIKQNKANAGKFCLWGHQSYAETFESGCPPLTKSILLFFKLKADNAFDVVLTDGALSIIKCLALTHKCHSLQSQLVDIPSRTNLLLNVFF